jgi:hypothetical protein
MLVIGKKCFKIVGNDLRDNTFTVCIDSKTYLILRIEVQCQKPKFHQTITYKPELNPKIPAVDLELDHARELRATESGRAR